ncbi:MMPL family transporter [Dactylosporangium sp. NPDC051484]|uniref:MMPL family transporter n=1 Tax=Dactylosporangium sp. NPDC051484 TaxID=3154942 RepID=UPI00344CC014
MTRLGTEPTSGTPDVEHRHRGAFDRIAAGIIRYPKTVIALWLVLIAATTPFAFQLKDVLIKQGASKIVDGTSSARAEDLVNRAFPHRTEREAVIVLSLPDAYDPAVPRLLAGLDARIGERQRTGEIEGTASAYTLHRDVALYYLKEAGTQLRPQALALAGAPGRLAEAWPQVVDGAVAAGQLPARLAGPLKTLGPDPVNGAVDRAAADYATGTPWRDFGLPVPAEALRQAVSADGDTALITATFSKRAGADPDVGFLRAAAADAAAAAGLGGTTKVYVTGELALIADTYDRADRDNTIMETAAYIVIGIVLLLFFRAVVPTILTVAIVALSMNVSQAALYWLGHEVTLTQFTVTIMTFVMLGAGVDYSMLLSSRYRQQRVLGKPVREAVLLATASAGESVFLAGIAVVLAFGAALLSPVDWVPPLGYGGLIGIPIILLAVLTLTPCVLILLGDRFFALGYKPITDLEQAGGLARLLRRVSALSGRRRWTVVAVFLVLTVPFLGLVGTSRFTADPAALSPATSSKTGFDIVAREWGKSAAFPTVIVGRAGPASDQITPERYSAVHRLATQVAAVDGVSRVDALTQPFGRAWTEQEVKDIPADVRRDFLSPGGVLRFVVVLRDDPFSDGAYQTLHRVDGVLAAAGPDFAGLVVGGSTRVDEQYGHALNRSFWQLVLLVSLAVGIVLVVALRSIVIPLQLIATIMISNVWAIGITVLVFDLWRHEAIINDLPVFLMILMMGLGMDYEIFLVTRVRELNRAGVEAERSIGEAVVDTGRVIGAAGLVMTGSLGAMLLSSTLMLQQYGVGLGTAVLLDATLIRMLFVPALLLILKRYNWWLPGRRRATVAPAGGPA